MNTVSKQCWILLCAFVVSVSARTTSAGDPAAVDVQTLHHKVLCGYQGWFRCPDDSAKQGWRHWSRDGRKISPETLTFEMWPDLNEFEEDEKYPDSGFTYSDGKPAHLFSSVNPKTVDRHFRWMQDYGIGRARFRVVPKFVLEDWGIDLEKEKAW